MVLQEYLNLTYYEHINSKLLRQYKSLLLRSKYSAVFPNSTHTEQICVIYTDLCKYKSSGQGLICTCCLLCTRNIYSEIGSFLLVAGRCPEAATKNRRGNAALHFNSLQISNRAFSFCS